MFQSKIALIALTGLLTIGGTGVTAFATEPTAPVAPEQPSISMNFDKEEKAAELAEKKANIEAKAKEWKIEKGLALEEAQAKLQAKLLDSGKTQEEIDAIMEKFTAKIEEVKAAKSVEIAEKKAEREANMEARKEKGIARSENSEEV